MNRLAVKNQRPGFPGAWISNCGRVVEVTQTMRTARESTAHPVPIHKGGPTGIVQPSRPAPATPSWSPTDRWAWACSLPVSGIARAVASCIARHANDKTGLAWPGVERIAEQTGFGRTAVKAGIQELERGGHLTVSRSRVGKKSRANRYQLPAMGGSPHDRGGVATRPGEGVATRPLISNSLESVKKKGSSDARAREVCEICGHDWPAEYGTECFECPQPTASQIRYREQQKRNRESEQSLTPEEEPEPELGKTRAKEEEDMKTQAPEGPASSQEAVGDADGNDLAWRDRLDEITTPSFVVRNHHGERAYRFPDGSRVVTSGGSWGFGVHSTRLEDFETRGRYEGHELATAWVGSGLGLTEADAGEQGS